MGLESEYQKADSPYLRGFIVRNAPDFYDMDTNSFLRGFLSGAKGGRLICGLFFPLLKKCDSGLIIETRICTDCC